MRSCVCNDFAYTFEQASIVEHRFSDGNAIPTELACVAHQTRGMSECPHRYRPIVCSHSAEFALRDKYCLRTQVRRAKRCGHARGSTTDYYNISHLWNSDPDRNLSNDILQIQ